MVGILLPASTTSFMAEAIALKEHLEKSVQLLGFPEGTDMSLLFSGMSHTINNLKKQLD